MALKTKGTQLFIIDPADCSILEVGCVTAINGIEATRDQLETTCLDSAARTYEAGMAAPGQMTFTIHFDPADNTHERIYELWQSGDKFEMAVALGDGDLNTAGEMDVPTADSSCLFDLPNTRSWIVTHQAYIANVPLTLALNALMDANVAVQLSGFPTLIKKGAS